VSLLIFVAAETCVNPWQRFDLYQRIRCSVNEFTEPLPSKWSSASVLCYSGFQAVFVEALSNNGHILHNILGGAFERYVISIRLQI
jgi:hypothetical protein